MVSEIKKIFFSETKCVMELLHGRKVPYMIRLRNNRQSEIHIGWQDKVLTYDLMGIEFKNHYSLYQAKPFKSKPG